MDVNTPRREYKFAREIKAPPKGSPEHEAEKRRDEALILSQKKYDLEQSRLEKEWKNSHPKSEHHLWVSDFEFAKKNKYPIGWLSSFKKFKDFISLNEKEFFEGCQRAMNEGGFPALKKFEDNLIQLELLKKFAPLKLDDDKPARESFPMMAFPKVAQDFCGCVSSSMGAPEDFAALGILGAMACAIGASTRLEIKPGWCEYAVIWLALCARPGAAKTPSLNACFKPIRGIQKELNLRYSQAMNSYRERLAQAKKDPSLELPTKPVAEFLLIGDVTQEALMS
jgi:Protein of unknown function (DUF3987)